MPRGSERGRAGAHLPRTSPGAAPPGQQVSPPRCPPIQPPWAPKRSAAELPRPRTVTVTFQLRAHHGSTSGSPGGTPLPRRAESRCGCALSWHAAAGGRTCPGLCLAGYSGSSRVVQDEIPVQEQGRLSAIQGKPSQQGLAGGISRLALHVRAVLIQPAQRAILSNVLRAGQMQAWGRASRVP